jgi:hypothetical protein
MFTVGYAQQNDCWYAAYSYVGAANGAGSDLGRKVELVDA